MGLGMVRVTDEEMAFRVFRTLETLRGVYYVQQTIDHAGCDVRAFVVGGRVIGAIERSAPGWKTNLARGGRARARLVDRKSTRLNSSHSQISYAVFCLKKKKKYKKRITLRMIKYVCLADYWNELAD